MIQLQFKLGQWLLILSIDNSYAYKLPKIDGHRWSLRRTDKTEIFYNLICDKGSVLEGLEYRHVNRQSLMTVQRTYHYTDNQVLPETNIVTDFLQA